MVRKRMSAAFCFWCGGIYATSCGARGLHRVKEFTS